MASTPLLGFTLPADGTTNWGTLVNTGLSALVDSAIAGTTTITTDADVTLSSTAESTNEARQMILLCSGARTGLRTIVAPSSSKVYIVINNTTGGFGVKIAGVGPTTGVTVTASRAAVIAWEGSDFKIIATTDLSQLSGILGVINGGTGLSSGTSGGVLGFTASGTIASSGVLAANALVVGGGAGFTPATTTTGSGVVAAIGNAVDAASGLATTTGTATLTNKRINPRVVTAGVTSGNLTINGDTTDLYVAEGLTGAITFLQPSGTPVDGQKLVIRMEDNGTGRAITWTTTSGAFRAVGIVLPTTTTASKVLYVACIYNSTDVFWDVLSTAVQA